MVARPIAPAQRLAPAKPLAAADAERLRKARGGARGNPTDCLYSPGGPVQRVNREAVLLAGGGRALMMQIAHPLVAAGVARHSGFEKDPLGRLWRTLDLTLTITFGDAPSALGAVREIERRHAHVRGRLGTPVGRFAADTAYDASDPHLLLWVHSTLVDSALFTYERFVRPLSAEDRSAYYEESKITARLFGVPEDLIPQSIREFDQYVRDTIDGDVLAIGAEGLKVAASIMDPPLPIGLRQLVGSGRIVTEGLLPPALRRRFGYDWSERRQRNLIRAQRFARRTLPYLPSRVRYFPHAVTAAQRDRERSDHRND